MYDLTVSVGRESRLTVARSFVQGLMSRAGISRRGSQPSSPLIQVVVRTELSLLQDGSKRLPLSIGMHDIAGSLKEEGSHLSVASRL